MVCKGGMIVVCLQRGTSLRQNTDLAVGGIGAILADVKSKPPWVYIGGDLKMKGSISLLELPVIPYVSGAEDCLDPAMIAECTETGPLMQ